MKQTNRTRRHVRFLQTIVALVILFGIALAGALYMMYAPTHRG